MVSLESLKKALAEHGDEEFFFYLNHALKEKDYGIIGRLLSHLIKRYEAGNHA